MNNGMTGSSSIDNNTINNLAINSGAINDDMAKNRTAFEDYIAKNSSLTYTNVGVSMLPLLRQGKDLFTIRAKSSKRCKPGDVVLYRRPPDKYVLHRVVEVHPTDYVILGDNCISKEYGITDKDIVGIMTGFVRSGREHSIEEIGYRLYSFIWMHTMVSRIFLKKTAVRLKRLLKKH